MKLKIEKNRTAGTCAAMRCSETEDLFAYAPGVAFDASQGRIDLCKRHREMRDAERVLERTAATPGPVVWDAPNPVPAAPLVPAMPAVQAPSAALVPITMPSNEVLARAQAETKEAGDILAMVRAFAVNGQADLDFANECLGDVKAKGKALEDQRKEATQHLDKALKVIRGWFKPALDFYGECEDIWKQKIRDGFLSLQQSQQAALQLAGAAHQAGNAQNVVQSMVAANAVAVSLPQNVSIIERWGWRVTDATAVPREYLAVDAAKIDGVVKAMKAETKIPGIEVYPDNTVVRRAC